MRLSANVKPTHMMGAAEFVLTAQMTSGPNHLGEARDGSSGVAAGNKTHSCVPQDSAFDTDPKAKQLRSS